MADLESNIRTFLLQDANIESSFDDRIFIDYVADGAAYPFAKISTVTESTEYTMDGEAIRMTMLQIDVYDDDKSTCNASAVYIRDKLSGYSGVLSDLVIGRIFMTNARSEWAPEARHFRRMLEAEIGWTYV